MEREKSSRKSQFQIAVLNMKNALLIENSLNELQESFAVTLPSRSLREVERFLSSFKEFTMEDFTLRFRLLSLKLKFME